MGKLLLAGFELQTSGAGSDRWSTTNTQSLRWKIKFFCMTLQKRWWVIVFSVFSINYQNIIEYFICRLQVLNHGPLSGDKHFARGCGSVGRVVTSDSTGPQFKSSYRQKCYWTLTVNCIVKTKIKIKEAGKGRFKQHLACSAKASVLL